MERLTLSRLLHKTNWLSWESQQSNWKVWLGNHWTSSYGSAFLLLYVLLFHPLSPPWMINFAVTVRWFSFQISPPNYPHQLSQWHSGERRISWMNHWSEGFALPPPTPTSFKQTEAVWAASDLFIPPGHSLIDWSCLRICSPELRTSGSQKQG